MRMRHNPLYAQMVRDVWGLGPSSNGYPGAFPRGFINRIQENKWWGDERLWLFAGSHKDGGGTTVDINPECQPDVVANCESLPFDDGSFDFVCLDPPYSELEAKQLYNLKYCNMPKVINEAARVCVPGGLMLILHRLVPWYGPWENVHKKAMQPIAIVGVYTLAGYTNMRALSVWRKNHTLLDFSAAQAAAAEAD